MAYLVPFLKFSTRFLGSGRILAVSPNWTNYVSQYRLCSTVEQVTKVFAPLENNFYRRYLGEKSEYSPLLFDSEKFSKSVRESDLSQFHEVTKLYMELAAGGNLLPVDAPEYQDLYKRIAASSHELSFEDILAILASVIKFPMANSPLEENYVSLWKPLDKRSSELSKGDGKLKDTDMLILLDAWSPLQLLKFTDFCWILVKRFFRRCDKLTKEEYVLFMYCLNRMRRIPKAINTYELEYNLNRHITELNAVELGIISAAFFKTNTPIRDIKLLRNMIVKIQEAAETIDSINITSFAKLVRLSAIRGSGPDIVAFCEHFRGQTERLSLTACTHLALIGTKMGVVNTNLLSEIVSKCEAGVPLMRLKELERMALVTGMCNYKCESFWDKIIEDLRKPTRANELKSFGRCVPCMLHYFTFQQKYPLDLISNVLSIDFIKTHYGKNYVNYSRDLLCLDLTMEIEVPDYKGNRLTEKLRHGLLKCTNRWIYQEGHEKNTLYQSNARSIKACIELAFKCNGKAKLINLIPQYNSIEILVCTNLDGEVLDLPEYYNTEPDYNLKRIPESEKGSAKLFHVVTLGTRLVEGSTGPTGEVLLKERQLRKLGYIVHRIQVATWINMDDAARMEYIKKLIQTECKTLANSTNDSHESSRNLNDLDAKISNTSSI